MTATFKKKKLIPILGSIVLLALAAWLILRFFVWKPSSQSDYPTLPPPDASVCSFEHTSMDQLYESSDLIVEATVTKVEDPVTQRIGAMGPNAEKLEGTYTELTSYDFQLHVDEVLLGNAPGEEITLSRGLLADAEPPLAEGDRMIFFLEYNPIYDVYISVNPHTAYYYLAHDNKVYPGEVTKATKDVSGMKTNVFKKQIREYAAAHPKTESE